MSLSEMFSRLDQWQQRVPAVAVPVAVSKKFVDDEVDKLGVQVAYWAFFSVFALLLAFTAILGFVFQNDPGVQRQLLDSTLERMPVLGPQIRGDIGSLTGSSAALVIGLLGALWTGLGVTLAVENALDRIWAVPHPRRAGFVKSRLRGLLVLLTIGTVNVMTTAAVGTAVAGATNTAVNASLSLVGSAVFDLAVFGASFRLLTTAAVSTRQVLPGALLATGCWLTLQAVGGVYVTQVLAGSSQTYGGFAAVVGLLAWLLIAAELVLLAAELNVVLARRLWPRSLTGPLGDADERALRGLADASQLDRRQRIAVSFEDHATDRDTARPQRASDPVSPCGRTSE